MRAFSGNELAAIPDDDMRRVWAAIMVRLGAIPEYRKMFEAAYPGTPFEKMTFAHASNAIAGFFDRSASLQPVAMGPLSCGRQQRRSATIS